MFNKRGQITIFVIIAIVIVAGIAVFFAVRGGVAPEGVPVEFQPIYDLYEGCIEQEARAAIDLAGSQGGSIFLDEYEFGSEFSPFGNQLNFLGFPVPYWYSLTGNGVVTQNVPVKADMEGEIARYVEERIGGCNLDSFYAQGFYVDLGEPEVDVIVEEQRVLVSVSSNVVASKEDRSASRSSYDVEIVSKLGKFYDTARSIYDAEVQDAFLEEYAVDVLRLYAPVDDVAISCSGEVWQVREVIDDLQNGLEANVGAIKLRGDYYSLSSEERNYYVADVDTDEAVNFIYDKSWPSRFEIDGADGELLIAQPIGSEAGLGTLGFCYSPYHFVYDLNFPVMIQIYDEQELFQFPVVVIVDNNLPREGEFSVVSDSGDVEELCDFATEDIEVSLFDVNLNPVDGDVTYNCFNNECRLGSTDGGSLVTTAPACLNGFLEVRAEGYAEKSELFSSNQESSADIILEREYDVGLSLEVDNLEFDGTAIINFESEDGTIGVAIPGSDSVKLTEGQYTVTVYAYTDSGVVIPASTKTQCQEIPRSGILGIFGATEEDCYDIEIPETNIEYALTGGGVSEVFILESELARGDLVVNVDGLPEVETLEQLQYNFESFEEGIVDLTFI